ncbi:pyridoxal phosphate-dependent aminotransferase [Streptococcus iniae]|uniref:pyridoxal phosphate-dependent aminotransferase n=1 Tax=Streptococcus iniae TaxID=1346 RepID=UPI002B2DF69F|nr:pyridoxal phosphate-dependent aminotransferase [Streptococcus iniae]WNZ93457.1 pyridoxal phosphate-dependent aminotransferase [Streptococcus iniae]WNZ97666.1 pyridoxal phosphate-dependent aminotransferase [Streptococcus iniae]
MIGDHSQLLEKLPEQFFAHLVQKVNAKVAEGYDVINLGQGNPDQPTYDYIVDALVKAVKTPSSHKYSQFRGNPSFKEAIARFYEKEYGVKLDPEKEICVLGGAKIGLVELPWALTNPGDLILLPDPGYPDYLSGTALSQVEYETYPLLRENDFLPDLKAIPEDVAQRAKYIFINYPNNPTGAVASIAFYEELVIWSQKYDVGVVSDFAYGALGYEGFKNPSFLQVKGGKKQGIELYTFSKTFNMAGWRLAFAVGNSDMIEALNLIQDHLFVSVFPVIQEAGLVALLDPQRQVEVDKLNQNYDQRRKAFVTATEKIGWKAFPSKGSFYVWMPVPEGYTSQTFADLLLEEAQVAVAPGLGFGQMGDGYVRIGLLVEPERLEEAVARIGKLNLF